MVPDASLAALLGRYTLMAYATAATILTTACLALHAVTALDRRGYDRRSRTTRDEPRPLFLPLEPGDAVTDPA